MLPIIITKKLISTVLTGIPVMAFQLLYRITCLKIPTKLYNIGKLEVKNPSIDAYLFYETSYNKIYIVWN